MTPKDTHKACWTVRDSIRVLVTSTGAAVYSLRPEEHLTESQMRTLADAATSMEADGESTWTMATVVRHAVNAFVNANEAVSAA